MQLTRVQKPDDFPVSLAEAKDWARVTHADHDAQLAGLIAAATEYLDGWSGAIGRCLLTQSWSMTLPGFSDLRRLPIGPVQSITSIRYAESSDSVVDFVDYRLVGDLVKPLDGWPPTACRDDAVTVEFVAGYGAPDEVPEDLRHAILAMVVADYDGVPWSPGVQRTLDKYRRIGV